MTTPTPATTLDIGTVDGATELVFMIKGAPRDSTHRYLLHPDGRQPDYLETLKKFPQYDVKRKWAA